MPPKKKEGATRASKRKAPIEVLEYKQNVVTPLRRYQSKICERLGNGNHLVVLPTGAGKTLVAAECIMFDLRHQSEKPVLFLVPTRQLVGQQAKSIHAETKLVVAELKGGSSLNPGFEVLVATPAAFIHLDPNLYSLAHFSVVVLDEIHHAVGKHPYNHISQMIHGIDPKSRPRVIGLSASPTYSIKDASVLRSIISLSKAFNLEHVHTATSDELKQSGYYALPETVKHHEEVPFVIENLLPGPRILFQDSELVAEFFKAVQKDLAHPLLHRFVTVIRAVEVEIDARSLDFVSPMQNPNVRLKEWGSFALKEMQKATLECSPSQSTCLEPFYRTLLHLYEALRLSIITRQSSIEHSALYLHMAWMTLGLSNSSCNICKDSRGENINRMIMQLGFLCVSHLIRRAAWKPDLKHNTIETLNKNAVEACCRVFDAEGQEIPSRLEHLKGVLIKIYDERTLKNEEFKGIVYVQARITTHILQHYVACDADLSQRFRSTFVYSANSNGVASLRCTSTQASTRFAAFGRGVFNLIFATQVAEEGIDIPSANCVIRFDPVLTPVSYVQGRGRAREVGSDFAVLSEMRADFKTMSLVPDCLVWELVKNNNSFIQKRNGRTRRSGRVVLSGEPNNLANLHKFKFSGLAKSKTIAVNECSNEDESYMSISYKIPEAIQKPADSIEKITMHGKDNKQHGKLTITKKAKLYRPDLAKYVRKRSKIIVRSLRYKRGLVKKSV